jgi:hypothetical protein
MRISWNQEWSLSPAEKQSEPDASAPLRMTLEQEAALRRIGELGAQPLESFATVLHFETAQGILECLHSYPLTEQCWAFRGHASADWKLEPSIQRLKNAYPHSFRTDAEEYVRQAFKRRTHLYLRELPNDKDELEWLALMRHHGAPTRLLDWTRSPYVAAFFATAEAKEDEVSVIWAIDIQAIKSEAIRILAADGLIATSEGMDFSFSDPEAFSAVFMRKTHPAIVAPVQPFRTSERVTSQQGLFLCPNDLFFGFEFGLKQVLRSDLDSVEKWRQERERYESRSIKPIKPERLFKLCITPQARCELLRELHRMNINYATLFPGLDGFARSLNTNLTISEEFPLFDSEFDFRI